MGWDGMGGAKVHDGALKNAYIGLLPLPSCAAYMYDFFRIVSETTFLYFSIFLLVL